jgi:transposase
MKRPQELELRREDGEALRQRLAENALTADDRRILDLVLQWYFWLLFTVQEARLSLKRLRVLLFGASSKSRKGPPSAPASGAGPGDGGAGGASMPAAASRSQAARPRQPGHGRQSAQAYVGAAQITCHHETLHVGERCPVCGRGRLYRVPPGVVLRLTGNAVVSAIHYALEKLRCSACGQVFTAPGPREAGAEKYTASARAALVVSRYYLGVPMYRLAGYQAMVGVPISDATQWEQIERVADCAYPVFLTLQHLAAQGDVIYQDDTHVRILSCITAHRQGLSSGSRPERTGMYTTTLVAEQGAHTICLYFSGRAHAGENLAALLPQRAATQGPLIVMSDALAANGTQEEGALIRCHCLAHGHRKFQELADVFPVECAVVLTALTQVFDHDAVARERQLTAGERLVYHQQYSGPLMAGLQSWIDQQVTTHTVEPNSSLGKALAYLQGHWDSLTQFLRTPGAPIDNNVAERALKLAIRQRKNSLFYATEHGAYIGSLLTSLIATCVQAGTNALAYLVALQTHRTAVFRDPAAWLPWNYQAVLAPP